MVEPSGEVTTTMRPVHIGAFSSSFMHQLENRTPREFAEEIAPKCLRFVHALKGKEITTNIDDSGRIVLDNVSVSSSDLTGLRDLGVSLKYHFGLAPCFSVEANELANRITLFPVFHHLD